MSSGMTLYWASGAPASWRVIIALEEKGLTNYRHQELPFEATQHREASILRLNPRGQVPILCDGGVVIHESLAICLYLEAAYKDKGRQLLPDDLSTSSAVLQRCFETENLTQRILHDIVDYKKTRKAASQDKGYLSEHYAAARIELGLWERYLSTKENQSHIVGKSFTLADIVLFPVVAILFRLGLNAAQFPALAFYYSQMKERSSIANTWPAHWLTSPNLTVLCDL